jgi:signal transduction histidine kinase
MFKNLRTSTKLFILCGVFIASIAVTTFNLVAEKYIAIDFARKELAGTRYLTEVRGAYAALLTDDDSRGAAVDSARSALAGAQAAASSLLNTAELERALAATLGELSSFGAGSDKRAGLILDALDRARSLAGRIGDDSNLTLDPDLDTFYVQDIVVGKMPTLLGQLGEARTILRNARAAAAPSAERNVRVLILDELLRSNAQGIENNLAAAYRGNPDGRLRQTVEAAVTEMISDASSFTGDLKALFASGQGRASDASPTDAAVPRAVTAAIDAWSVTQAELDRLLQQRIDGLFGRLWRSLTLTGAVSALSIVIAFMTHRHIVRPLERLEDLARMVRETKDYSIRTELKGRDEIGRLALAFNDMLAELAKAREREIADRVRTAELQSDFARVARSTAISEMAASIAHEINQPLGAIVANGNAGLRWLKRQPPDFAEAQGALGRIVADGRRAGEIIASIRALLTKTSTNSVVLDINELVREVLALTQGEMRNQRVVVHTELAFDLPRIVGDRVQLQQVVTNLIINAAEAMGSIADQTRALRVTSAINDRASVRLTVEDSGTGIEPESLERIFDAFFTTKSHGMGMGLSICRSIVQAHGGSLAAFPRHPHGSVFQVILPTRSDAASQEPTLPT